MKLRATRKAQALILRILKARQAGKTAYRKAEELAEQLKAVLPVGEAVELADGRKFAVQDMFATKATAYKTVGIDRFQLLEQKA